MDRKRDTKLVQNKDVCAVWTQRNNISKRKQRVKHTEVHSRLSDTQKQTKYRC